jgi:cephalosporin-C deacetylase-like acetyl esterase
MRLLLLSVLLSFCLPLRAQTITVTPDRASGLYRPGETVTWTISVDLPASLKSPAYTVKTGNIVTIDSGNLSFTDGKATIRSKATTPGWLLLEVTGTSATNTALKVNGGALFGDELITQADQRPADFDSFWDGKLAALNALPINPVVTPGTSGVNGVDYATVTLDCIAGTHVQGQLARPTGTAKCPAMLIVQWAGVYSLQKSWITGYASAGWLVLDTQAHDITPIAADSYYNDLSNGALKEYWRQGNEDRETSYFLRMYLATHRAIEYLASRPDWDGRTLIVMGGSQGGLQSLVAAALNPRVTAVLADVPAGSDQAGLDAGREPGWPQWAWQAWDRDLAKVKQAARYYDVSNFAPRVHCPVLIGVGLIDIVVPCPGVYATYNQLSAAKEIVPMPDADHTNKHDLYQTRNSAWLNAIKAAQPPQILVQPQASSGAQGSRLSLSVIAKDPLVLGYQWYKDAVALPGATAASLVLGSLSAADAGTYTVQVTSPSGQVLSQGAQVQLSDAETGTPTASLSNLSARAFVGTGNDLLIAGFVVSGSGSKRLLLRGIGPALAPYGVSGTLANPQLSLVSQANVELASNDDWNTAPDSVAIRNEGFAAGAFPLPEGGRDAALLVTLPPGAYTALLRGTGIGTGVGLVEVYDLDQGSSSHLSNLSSRALVNPAGQLIAGYVLSGSGSKQILLRAMGPSLTAFGITNPLAKPALQLYSQDNTLLSSNNGWENSLDALQLQAKSDIVGASPRLLPGSADSALLLTQSPTLRTALVDNKTTTAGVVLAELYEVP